MNVICLLTDTLRRDYVNAYGMERVDTPNLDRFSRQCHVFENSYMSSYPCMPARQDLWTGNFNFLWRGWSPLEYTEIDLAARLRRHQKQTFLVTDHYHLWQAGAGNYHFSFHGVEFIRGQENDNCITDPETEVRWPASKDKLNPNWEKYARNTQVMEEEEAYFTPKVFRAAIDCLTKNKKRDDMFLMIDLFDPHEPFDPPQSYIDRYDPGYEGESVIWPRYGAADKYSEQELKHMRALYSGEISLMDKWFGNMLDRLEQLGMMDNTMIVLTSDHGFLFGEHNWVGKHSQTLYNHICHTPLLVYHPQYTGKRQESLVQMADLYPTILEAMDVPVPEGIHGKSVLPFISGSSAQSDEYRCFGVYGGSVYVTDGEWTYVRRPQQRGPLYWYTDSHFSSWGFGQKVEHEQSQERVSYFREGRFPYGIDAEHSNAANPRVTQAELQARTEVTDIGDYVPLDDELFHNAVDYEQEHNVIDRYPEIKTLMLSRLKQFLINVKAPEEQLVRLGL
ncbi:sulfatase [Paenibacillus thalictri]|uniref:DUF229 domain-containing protein n=1 Tax=Paenibacillus thalictri TaxID=2527873 RepID=A0A4Q9DCT1_9BACL|nr:sulfatase [Paenibacillus thalictri]TBL68480.1 DUF229 domain-containing protein [Paenibacillus thalictri]